MFKRKRSRVRGTSEFDKFDNWKRGITDDDDGNPSESPSFFDGLIMKLLTGDFNMPKLNWRIVTALSIALLLLILTPMMFGVNEAGYRTVVRYPNGTLFVKFTPGVYTQWFGATEEYTDVITFDFDKDDAEGEASLDQPGIPVRYQDGGTGTIFGKARFALPADQDTMIKLHKDFRSNQGVAYKLIKSITEEAQNMTAGLMSSEEAYAEKRGIFTEWSRDQLKNGKYKTKLQQIHDTDDATGKRVLRNVPVIAYQEDNITPTRLDSDFKDYGITVSGYQVTDWGFERKTLDQISTKREATMAIITAKANAERAKQETITSEEQGKKNVKVAQYEKEVEKQKAIVDAERAKEVATIKAQQKVVVAEQNKLEAEQKKLAANEYKQEQILRGDGDAAYKKAVIEADGALQQKLDTYVRVSELYADAISKQKWVPEVNMGSGGSGEGNNSAQALIDLFTTKAARDLSLDMSINQ